MFGSEELETFLQQIRAEEDLSVQLFFNTADLSELIGNDLAYLLVKRFGGTIRAPQSTFPPTRTGVMKRTHLPFPVTSLIGREGDIAAVRAWLYDEENCHGPEVPEIGEAMYLEHAMVNRVSRVAMDNAERAVNNGQVFGEEPGSQRNRLCTTCHSGDGDDHHRRWGGWGARMSWRPSWSSWCRRLRAT